MNKLIAIVVVCCMLALPAFAIEGKYETKDVDNGVSLVNGAGWQSFRAYEKELYVRGIMDTISSCSMVGVVFEDSEMDQDTLSFIESLSRLVPPDVPVPDIVKSIDSFYGDEKNIKVPIVSAYFYELVKTNQWADEAQMSKALEKLRDYASGKPRPKKTEEETVEYSESKTEPAAP